MSFTIRNTILLALVVISTSMHWEHFSKDLMSIHVWRQTQTQSTINNFYQEDMNILNPRRNDRGDTNGIFRMEFPLMQWSVAVLYKVFGKNLVISRIFMFIIGLITTFGLYRLVQLLFDNQRIAILSAWAFTFSPSFYYYTINPLPDNLALCLSIWGLVFFFRWLNNKKALYLLNAGVFLSLGALCKLPFIVFFSLPLSFLIYTLVKRNFKPKGLFQFQLVFLPAILPIAWYASVIPSWDSNPILKGVFESQDSIFQILGYLQHNLISTLPELLLNYGSVLFFLAGFYYLFRRKAHKNPRFIFILSLAAAVTGYYLFEANAIGTVHDYYLFPFYPLLFILVGYGAYHLIKSKVKPLRYLSLILLLALPATCYLRMQTRWNPESPGFNKDLLVYKEELRKAVPNDALVVAGNDLSHFIFFYYIDKKGWGFQDDHLYPEKLEDFISKGAEYIYVDSKNLFEDPKLQPYLKSPILQAGTVRVYALSNTDSSQ